MAGDDPRGSEPTAYLGWTGGWTGDDYTSLWLDHCERLSSRTLVAGPLTRRLSPGEDAGMAPAVQHTEAIPQLPAPRR